MSDEELHHVYPSHSDFGNEMKLWCYILISLLSGPPSSSLSSPKTSFKSSIFALYCFSNLTRQIFRSLSSGLTGLEDTPRSGFIHSFIDLRNESLTDLSRLIQASQEIELLSTMYYPKLIGSIFSIFWLHDPRHHVRAHPGRGEVVFEWVDNRLVELKLSSNSAEAPKLLKTQ